MTKRKKSCKGCACAAWDCFTRKWRGMTDSIRCCYCIRHKNIRIEDRFVRGPNAPADEKKKPCCDVCQHFDPDRMYGMCKLTGAPRNASDVCRKFATAPVGEKEGK